MTARELRLSHAEYNALWRRLNLGDKPLVLDTPDLGPTLGERDALDERAWRQLHARGLVDLRRAAPDVEDVLGALARPEVEADLRMWTGPGEPITALASAAGTIGAVATVHDGGLVVRPARPSDLASALLAQVPDHPAAPGNGITVPEGLVSAGMRGDTPLDQLERGGLSPSEARQFRRLVSGRTVRQIKIGAAARDRAGRRHRAPDVVSVLDTEAGRIQMRALRGSVLLHPADRNRLGTEIAALINSAVAAATTR